MTIMRWRTEEEKLRDIAGMKQDDCEKILTYVHIDSTLLIEGCIECRFTFKVDFMSFRLLNIQLISRD